MKKKTTPTSWVRSLPVEAQKHLCSAWALDSTPFSWDNRWGMPLEAAAAGAFAGDDVGRPPTSSIFYQARRWHRIHAFVQHVTAIRMACCNYGLLGRRITPVNPKKPDGDVTVEWHPGIRAVDPKDRDRVKAWKEKNRDEIARVIVDCWMSRFITRNIVALWRKRGRVIIRPPETCNYDDQFGNEQLSFKHGLVPNQIDSFPGLTKSERDYLRGHTEVKLTHDDERLFAFRVCKDEPIGMGFSWPDLATVFHACSLNESLLVGDRQLADACRSVYEHHKLGHEIRSGNHAGSPAHFMKKPRADAVTKMVKGKKGHIQIITNFDHSIEIGGGRPKPEQYDTKRYAQAAEQLAIWGLPYAQMLHGVINPYLMTLARAMAGYERERVHGMFSGLLRDGMGAPADVMCVWDDTIFWDSRLLLDLIKAGLQAGPISGESFLQKAGFVPADEREAKARDAALPEEHTHPLFDPAHGQSPGKGGKPPGKNDKS